jgi:rSAM/selenodomain-associated transferase 1
MIPFGEKTRCTAVFVKAPVLGRVKTRLSKVLGQETVLDLYKCFVTDIIATLNDRGPGIQIFYYPSREKQKMVEWLGSGLPLFPQEGENLGERMAHAFKKSFSDRFRQVVLVGTDFPDLPAYVFDEAFEAININRAVIGPAFDGGYYLIGFHRDAFTPDIFKDMPWGSKHVFKKTMDVFKSKGIEVHVLPKWRDIDRPEDLRIFMETNAVGESAAKTTLAYLAAHKF